MLSTYVIALDVHKNKNKKFLYENDGYLHMKVKQEMMVDTRQTPYLIRGKNPKLCG